MKKVVHAVCPHDCPDSCSVLITIEDGRATKLQGNPDHPVTRGFLCAKVSKYLDRVYSPDRVLYPMRRRQGVAKGAGARGPRDFERITWDEALTEIATRFQKISDEFGPEAIMPYSYAGNMAVLGYGSMDRRFFHRLGASQLARTICSTAGGEALVSVYGVKLGTDTEDFRHSKLIIAWGANVLATNVHLWPFIEEARRNGARFVVLDPYKTRTARLADWYIPINPGTDGALALGMMRLIINEKLYDADYVSKYTEGFEQLREKVQPYTLEHTAQLTGIPAADIEKLAREYAATPNAAIRLNYGIQRTDFGGMAIRSVAMLPCLTGAWKHVGGGLQLSTSGAFPLNHTKLQMPELMKASPLGREARTLNMSTLGEALLTVSDPPVKGLFVYNSNPGAVAPNHADVVRGLKREDLFTVVHEQFFTDTTDYADILLPATTFFEHDDIQNAYGHYYLQHSAAAIAPLGECLPNVEVFRRLAAKMGFTEACFRDTEEKLIEQAVNTTHERFQGITRERLETEKSIRLAAVDKPFLPFAKGFPTPSGKALLYNESLKAIGLDPVVDFKPPIESRHRELAKKFPLEMLARKADNYMNSTFANGAAMQKLEKPQLLEMSAADASPRNIKDGDRVRVFNDRGSVLLTAHVNGAVQPGVVASRLNWAKLSPDGKNVNTLTSERITDIGAGATFYSALVEVEKA